MSTSLRRAATSWKPTGQGEVGVLPLRLVGSRRERELSGLLDDGSVVALEVHR